MFEQTFKNIDDILHKDAGCTSELDYTEQSSWLLFLKYLDNLETDKAAEAELEAKTWEAHLNAIDAEGIDASAYAKREGLAVSNLYYWRRRLKLQSAGDTLATTPPGRSPERLFVPVAVGETAAQSGRCLLILTSGVRLELSSLPSPQWLAQVSQALALQVR